jgi:hypothetical protein
MDLRLERVRSDNASTLGRLMNDAQFLCHTLEDEYREGPKVPGHTRIPAGTYRLRLKALHESRLDADYIRRFGAFHRGMIELEDVPGFAGILIHIGNYDADTDGCILVGLEEGRDERGHYSVLRSEAAYRQIYPPIANALANGESSTIQIVDHDR